MSDFFGMSDKIIAGATATEMTTIKDNSTLPHYLHPPERQVFRYKTDFIMLTEFTEDIGPVPLSDFTIPKRKKIETNGFDLDRFATTIMSADYFAHAGPQEQTFRMPDSLHALISNTHTQCYTLLYAFTLYDIHGRGYVRPLYLAYTTHDRTKLVHIYEWLTELMEKAVHRVTHSNMRYFAQDLELLINSQKSAAEFNIQTTAVSAEQQSAEHQLEQSAEQHSAEHQLEQSAEQHSAEHQLKQSTDHQLERSAEQHSADHQLKQSAEQHSADHQLERPAEHQQEQSTDHQLEQSAEHQLERSAEHQLEQSAEQHSADHQLERPAKHQREQSTDHQLERSADHQLERFAEQHSADHQLERSAEQHSVDHQLERSAEQSARQQFDQLGERQLETSVKQRFESPTGKLTEESTEKRIVKSAEQQLEKSAEDNVMHSDKEQKSKPVKAGEEQLKQGDEMRGTVDEEKESYIRHIYAMALAKLAHLERHEKCCDFKPLAPHSSSSLDESEIEVVHLDGEPSLRAIECISDYWDEFKRDLKAMHQMFNQSYLQICEAWRERLISQDPFNRLNIGQSSLAKLKFHTNHRRGPSKPRSASDSFPPIHKDSVASVDSMQSYSTWHSMASTTVSTASSMSSSPAAAAHLYGEPTSLTSTDFSSITSDPGVNSLNSDVEGGVSSLTRSLSFEPDPDLTSSSRSKLDDSSRSVERTLTDQQSTAALPDEQFVMERYGDGDSISTDSLLSRNETERGYNDYHLPDPVLSTSFSKLVSDSSTSQDRKQQAVLKSLISNHKEHIKDLIYSVMISRPVVLVETSSSKGKEQMYLSVAIALTSFLPNFLFKSGDNDRLGFHIIEEEINLKSICLQPITCLLTSTKSVKISDNIRSYASIYYMNTKKYEGAVYGRDTQSKRSTQLLDLFYRKKKHGRPYYGTLVKSFPIQSLLINLASKAQLLHSLLQKKDKPQPAKLQQLLGLSTQCDLNIIKNLVHAVLKQQYTSSRGLKEEDISAMSMMLTQK